MKTIYIDKFCYTPMTNSQIKFETTDEGPEISSEQGWK